MTRLKADILDIMSQALARVTFARGETLGGAATAFKTTEKTTTAKTTTV